MTLRIRSLVATVVALAAISVLGVYVAGRHWGSGLPVRRSGPECTVQAGGRVTLKASQMANAATIAAVGIRRGMSERAIVVALSAALQESKLENLAAGDRDSVGLFQQRPSQGWGTPDQLRDPRYAAGLFYNALRKVHGWEHMRITDAAQAVQRSAYPEAYQRWADKSAVLAKALLGQVTGAVACTLLGNPVVRGAAAASGLAEGMLLDWGRSPTTDLLSLAMAVSDARSGWRYAHWLVSHARDNGIRRVRFAGMEWTATGGVWAPFTTDRSTDGDRVVADVFGDR